jgi:hypothetical protein
VQTIRNRILLCKVESVYGTDPTPVVGTDALEAKNVKFGVVGDLLKRDNIRGNISPVAPVVGKRHAEITFDLELKGSGTAGVAGKLDAIFQACSFVGTATVVSGSSCVQYLPVSSSQKSVTVYLYDMDSGSAVLKKITGAVGSFSLKGAAGSYATLSVTLKGLYNEPADVALPAAPTYESTVPPVIQSAAFTIASVGSLVIQDLSIDLANSIAERDDISSANGVKSFFIVSREPKGSINPEATQISIINTFNKWANSTTQALSAQIGSTAGNIIAISAPKALFEDAKDGDRNGVLTRDSSIAFGQNAGNDELVFNFF